MPEYSLSLDEEGICKTAFELIFAFDEVISLGHKENVTVAQVKQYCEMESHEEKLHKLVLQSKINETKDVMKRKASEIDKSKVSGKAPQVKMISKENSIYVINANLSLICPAFCRLKRIEVIKEDLCPYSQWVLEELRVNSVI